MYSRMCFMNWMELSIYFRLMINYRIAFDMYTLKIQFYKVSKYNFKKKKTTIKSTIHHALYFAITL